MTHKGLHAVVLQNLEKLGKQIMIREKSGSNQKLGGGKCLYNEELDTHNDDLFSVLR
jgi:hypothetical protein